MQVVALLSAAMLAVYVAQDRGQELLDAAQAGEVDEVRALLEAGVDPNTRDEDGASAFIIAAGSGHRELASALLESGADVNLTASDESAALAAAAKGGHTELVRDLLKAGADVNAQNRFGVTALMVAARNGNPETIEALLDGGADVNIATPRGGNAIRIASMENHVPATLLLLEAGADPQSVEGRETPLTGSIREGLVSFADVTAHPDVTAYALVLAHRVMSGESLEPPASRAEPGGWGVGNASGGPSPGGGARAARPAWDTEPVVLYKPPNPEYPALARKNMVSGEVILQIKVRTDGSTEVVEVIESPPYVTETAKENAVEWRWKPAEKDGEPVEAFGIIIVAFEISKKR